MTRHIVKVDFYKDMGYLEKIQEKTDKQAPPFHALRQHWSEMMLICVLASQAGTTMSDTQGLLDRTLAISRPAPTHISRLSVTIHTTNDTPVPIHDRKVTKTRLDNLCKLA